ncbi:sugar ABC transporter ATP-binding protein [Antarcticimicrobium luteum]|nr:sugar ABC transporter ATP-binding protein [Antarcticimicrobium luteum]
MTPIKPAADFHPNGEDVVLQLSGLKKEFPGVKALDGVDFELRRGEVHALLGANGAGKSTLIKIVAGLYQRDGGTIRLEGQEVSFGSTAEAMQAGIGIIYQDFALVPDLSVAENIFLGQEMRNSLGLVQRAAQEKAAQELLDMVGANFAATALVSSLGSGQRQQVEIAKALRNKVKVLILDEPTASLSHGEAERLFEIIRQLADEGVGIIYVSHRLEEIAPLVDRVTALRDGVSVGSYPTAALDRQKIVSLITGSERPAGAARPARAARPDLPPLLSVQGLSRAGEFDDVSFALHPGEILVLTGLVGAGRTELAETLFGVRHADAGKIRLGEKIVHQKDTRDAIRNGIALIPEDRRGQGVSLMLPIDENVALPILRRFRGPFGLARRRIGAHADQLIDRLSIRTPNARTLAGALSGGNQQKVVLAKWLSTDAQVFLFDEPTQGVDVGAKAEIYALIEGLAAAGRAILIVSSDLEEVLAVADRVLAMRAGRIVEEFENNALPASRVVDAITNG